MCTKEEFALRLGVSRAALYRELAFLQKNDTITQSKNLIIIKDEIKLRKIFNEIRL